MLIEYAYHVRANRISGGPTWLGSHPDIETADAIYLGRPAGDSSPWEWSLGDARYDVDAKGDRNATQDQLRSMLQSLLEDRFHLKVHREMRDLPLFELVVAKGGPKLNEAADCGPTPAETGCGAIRRTLGDGGFLETARAVSMSRYAEYLAALPEYLGIARPVLDKTGLTGKYDFNIEFAPGQD
jgi:uncharacterized protein (TIGR03435 family)